MGSTKKAGLPAIKLKEETVQAAIVEYFTILRYSVLQSSRRGSVCQHCGLKTFGPDGASKGLPDVLIAGPRYPKGAAVLIECKGTDTKVSPEQQALSDAGRIFICRSLDDAVKAVREFEESIGVRRLA